MGIYLSMYLLHSIYEDDTNDDKYDKKFFIPLIFWGTSYLLLSFFKNNG